MAATGKATKTNAVVKAISARHENLNPGIGFPAEARAMMVTRQPEAVWCGRGV